MVSTILLVVSSCIHRWSMFFLLKPPGIYHDFPLPRWITSEGMVVPMWFLKRGKQSEWYL